MPAKKLNVKAILDHLGGITDAHAAMVKSGAKIKRQSLQKWTERGNIPSGHLLTILAVAERQKRPIELKKFTITT